MTNSRNSMLAAIANAVLRIKALDPSGITPESRLMADLGFGSIDIIDLFFEIEKETNIEISVPEMYSRLGGALPLTRRDFSVGEIIDFLAEKHGT